MKVETKILVLTTALLMVLCSVECDISTATALTVIGADTPVLAPNNEKLVFSYQGDIWEVRADGGTARRLTINTADDLNPAFSPDGKWIAFSSNRHGNFDIYIMLIQ